ncbi:MAG: ATP synthase subunit C [Betaproteobacteria bacterium]|nr:ATP synthase subunit C [Betaproteobacteria bacterium]
MADLTTQALGWAGIYGALALAALGSIAGCARAGQVACGALLDVDGGYGRYIGLAAMPASQTVYGVVIMLALNRPVTGENAGALFAVGLLAGIVQMASAIYQGECCAAAIQVAKSKPEIFGLSAAPAALVEGFAVFALAFALVLVQRVPAA